MKIFIVGGVTVPDMDSEYPSQLEILNTSMRRLGERVIVAGHDLLTCSPFLGAADLAAIHGATKALGSKEGPVIEFHYPDTTDIGTEIGHLTSGLAASQFQQYPHPVTVDETGQTQWQYSWLLAQLTAMDRSHVVIGLGGKLASTASLLLALVESRRKYLLPLTFLGGAAAQAYQRRRYELEDRLGDRVAALHQAEGVDQAVALAEELSSAQLAHAIEATPLRIFLSYPRSRPEEADFVEMTLRRRNFQVYRDERDFQAGRPIPREIIENIH